ncbi:MAG TPA: hypothetical protein VL282_02215 [Tepidisphaeraceae bacterium]|jgi:hypothetical protein|nr:hypothetical protein [Tepidisphaeraceae bacterium]
MPPRRDLVRLLLAVLPLAIVMVILVRSYTHPESWEYDTTDASDRAVYRGVVSDRGSLMVCRLTLGREVAMGYRPGWRHVEVSATGWPRTYQLLGWIYWNYVGGMSSKGIPTHAVGVGVPYWFIALALLVPPWRAWRLMRRTKRAREGYCYTCGYDLRASPEKCPECGAATACATST